MIKSHKGKEGVKVNGRGPNLEWDDQHRLLLNCNLKIEKVLGRKRDGQGKAMSRADALLLLSQRDPSGCCSGQGLEGQVWMQRLLGLSRLEMVVARVTAV